MDVPRQPGTNTATPVREDSHSAPPDEALRGRYLANMRALYAADAALAERLEQVPFAALPRFELARDGRLTARVTGDRGQPVYLHSRHHPADEARTFVQALPAGDSPVFFLNALGLGYHVAELERRFERPLLIVAEDDLLLVKAALLVHDLSAPLGEGRLILLTQPEMALVHERLAATMGDLLLGLQLVQLPYAASHHVPFRTAMQALILRFVEFSRVQIVTLLKINRATFRNVAYNLSSYVRSADLNGLRNRAAGRPAIILAAGPSLAQHLDALGALRERAVFIAVQTVFKLLHARRFLPHFVVSLDYHEVSAEFFSGVRDVGDCVLVAEPKVTWHVLDLYPGRTVVLHHALYDRLLRRANPLRGGLRAGSTVAHLAFYLAQHLGCDPILLVGQDLCYPEGLFYPPGTPIDRIWQPELNRFYTVEMKQWERIARHRPILRRVQDVQGRDVYTDDLLHAYAEQFQADFARSSARVVQIGSTGMRLHGAEPMSLAQATATFCSQSLPGDLLELAPTPPTDKAALLRELHARQREIDEVRAIAVEVTGLLERLAGLTERPAEFNRVVARVDELRTRMQRQDETYALVVEVAQAAELRRHGADRRLGRVAQESVATAQRRLERDRDFVGGFIDGCEFLLRCMPAVVERVEDRLP
jgi:hypothetical protein